MLYLAIDDDATYDVTHGTAVARLIECTAGIKVLKVDIPDFFDRKGMLTKITALLNTIKRTESAARHTDPAHVDLRHVANNMSLSMEVDLYAETSAATR